MRSPLQANRWLGAILSPDGIITALSGNAGEYTGYSAGELVGQSVGTILSPSSALELEYRFRSNQDCSAWEGAIEHCGRHGASHNAHACLMPMQFGEGSGAGFLLVSVFEGEAVQGAQSASLQGVASYLRKTAHDLNNPLAVMVGLTQLILLDGRCGEGFRGDIERLYAAMTRVVEIIEDLHAYAFSLQQEPRPAEQPDETAGPPATTIFMQPGLADQSR